MSLADNGEWPGEEWRPIPGYDNYEASSFGRIRSLDRYLDFHTRWGGVSSRFHRGRILRPKRKDHGFLAVCTDGRRYLEVARGVALAFHGEPLSDDHESAHRNGISDDNRPDNLKWSTRLEISDNSRNNGTLKFGSDNPGSTLKEAQIPVIIARYAAGDTAPTLSDEYGVSPALVNMIVRGEVWSHIDAPMREAAKLQSKENILKALRREFSRQDRDALARVAGALLWLRTS